MYTIYNFSTGEVRETITARSQSLAYRRAERICERDQSLAFDDTCDHGTAYDLCKQHEAVSA